MAGPPVVVGLGNPGERYAGTRHNIGFAVLDRILEQYPAVCQQGPRAEVYRPRIAGRDVVLVRPLTFMNLSGTALLDCPESAAAGPGGHLVVFDDAALPFGGLRFRPRGSSGGHRGLESVIDCLGTDQVPRLRLGVGHDPERDLRDYVLEPFSQDEQQVLGRWLERIIEGIETCLTEGIEAAMNTFNG